MKLVVGLGNPGDRYKKTRHNIWFTVINQFLDCNKIGNFSYDNKYGWEICVWNIDEEKTYFLKPMEYMNRSGQAVKKLMNFYKIETKDLLVIHDDIDLQVGKIQFKFWWWLAWHNGLKDIAEKIWSKDFARVRIWIDRPIEQSQVSDYVLSNFKKEEIEKIQYKYLDFEKLIFEFLK